MLYDMKEGCKAYKKCRKTYSINIIPKRIILKEFIPLYALDLCRQSR